MELSPSTFATAANELVSSWPPITDAQADALATLLAGGAR